MFKLKFRLLSKSEINHDLEQLQNTKSELENRLNNIEQKQKDLEELKKKPLGPTCPFCGKTCKNTKGLKIHIQAKAKYELNGPHFEAYYNGDYDLTKTGKVRIRCQDCGSWTVLNGRRKDIRLDDQGGFDCLFCSQKEEEKDV